MTNESSLRDAIRERKSAVAAVEAAKADAEKKRQEVEAFVRQRWPTCEQLLREAIVDGNKYLSEGGDGESFAYRPMPQPGVNVAAGVIRLQKSTGAMIVEAALKVTTLGEIIQSQRRLARPFDERFRVENCTRPLWDQMLTKLFKRYPPTV